MRAHTAVLALLVLTAAACGSNETTSAPVSTDTWATVDGREIRRADVEKAFQRLGAGGQPLSDEEALGAKLNLLEDLIVQDILLARAGTLGVTVSDADVNAAFGEARKGIPDETFTQELAKRNLTEAEMREGIRRELLAQKVIEQEVGGKITVSDQEVTTFFEANRAQFNLPEEAFHIAQIVVTPVRDPQVANRMGDDAQTPQSAASKAQMLMQRLKEGATFADLARDYSEDPESAPAGGDLGLVPISAVKQAPPPLRDAVLNGTPGNARMISGDGQFTIVFLVKKEPAGQRDLSTPGVKDQISTALRTQREQLLRAAYLTQARTDADVTNYLARQVTSATGVPADLKTTK